MSTPKSRLSAFRSYSYYHVLTMCDSSNTANLLAHTQDPSAWDHATSDTAATTDQGGVQDLGKYSPKCISDPTGANTNRCAGRYIVLIDGSTDAAFSITQARWSSATAAAAVPGAGNTSLAVEGSINVSEPKGVAFLDQVVKCSIALGVDSSQVAYCLKTFFVGYTYDPETGDTPVRISDIPPINFLVYDVTGSFTDQGGTYEMLFVALASGATRLPQYSKAVNTIQLTSGDSLVSTMAKLNQNINASYNAYYACVESQLRTSGSVEANAFADTLSRVQYVIKVGEAYQGPEYTVSESQPQSNNTSECGGNVQISLAKNTSIEAAINYIMLQSPKVRADMAIGDTSDKVKYEYKIHTCLKSGPITGSDKNVGKLAYTVYYRVEQFQSPKAMSFDPTFQLLAQDDIDNIIRDNPTEQYRKLRDNIIKFDYLYTGNNTDILEFDMKVNMGMAYLQTATIVNTLKGQLERAPVKVTSGSSADASQRIRTGKFGEGPGVQTPVFFGKQIGTPKFMNSVNSGHAIQSAYTLAKHASLEVAEAQVKILGNDLLLHSTNVATSPEYMIAQEKAKPEDTDFTPGEANFKYWSLVPAYVKIKIKMPRDQDDFTLFTGQANTDGTASGNDYARDFWFDGYYYVYGIDHVFDNGEFTQTLNMVGIPKASVASSLSTASNAVNFDTGVDKCFDNVIGCGRPPGHAPGPVVSMPPPSTPTSVTPNDAKSIAAAPKDLSNVIGWDNIAKPHVKAAIINAANGTGVNAVTLAQFAYLESTFGPDKTTEGSDALGLYQFVPGTWDISSIKPLGIITPQVLANKNNRRDPTLSAYAAALYLKQNTSIIGSSAVGDLYLAHFLGPGGPTYNNGAWKIIKDDKNGNGSLTITQSLPQSVKKIIAANKGVFTPNTTVREVRNWAADKMAISSLKQPIVVARNAATPTFNPLDYTRNTEYDKLNTQDLIATTQPKRTAADAVAAFFDCKSQTEKKESDKDNCNWNAFLPGDVPTPSAEFTKANQAPATGTEPIPVGDPLYRPR